MYEIEGNPNHIFYQFEGVSDFTLEPKKYKKYIHKKTGIRNSLYNGDYKHYTFYDRDFCKAHGRSRRKHTQNIEIKGDLGKCKEFVLKK